MATEVFMAKYLINRIIRGIISVIIVVGVVMLLIYTLMDRMLIFAADPSYNKKQNNDKVIYRYQQWESFGYLDYVTYQDYLVQLKADGEIDETTRAAAVSLGRNADYDGEVAKIYVEKFKEYYESQGYTVTRLDAKYGTRDVLPGGSTKYFASKDINLFKRLISYYGSILFVDSIHYAQEVEGERGLSFTWYDPAYGGNKFSPAIMGNGTKSRYLVYFDNQFPFIHQNIVSISLGKSYSVRKGIDVFDTMTQAQGILVKSTVTYPTGYVEESADNLHTLQYSKGSLASGGEFLSVRYNDDYTVSITNKSGMSKMGYSFTIGILSVIMAYVLGVPLGILMARKKDKIVDKLGTIYIIFIIAVPSLAYIFMFKAIGALMKLPTTFDITNFRNAMYILPVVSLALPSVANLMKWLRRYMIDQMNSDYVKFARSGGLSEREIFNKHILKNAIIPLVHGVPGAFLGAMVGAFITERVYVVPGTGNLLVNAISAYDNSVIVGVTLFISLLSIISIIMGDILMATVDPRISFSSKAR